MKHQQTTAFRIATGCIRDTNTQHPYDKTHIRPIKEHLQLHASQKTKITPDTHYTTSHHNRRNQLIIYNNTDINTNANTINHAQIKTNMKHIHTTIANILDVQIPYRSSYNTHQSNSSDPGPTQKKQAPITTVPSLNRTIHNTLVQLHEHRHTTQGHGFVESAALMEGPPVSQRAWILTRWGILSAGVPRS